MSTPIHHTFAPLADRKFCLQAFRLLLQPWKWRRGIAVKEFREALREKFSADCFLFSSGRESLFALFQSLHIGPGDEVIVQSYTCVVVPNAIAAAGATPVFVDIVKETLSLDPEEVRKAMTPKTKAVICQHTFGIPAPLEVLKKICDERRIPLIEDCAHVIADEDGPVGIGTTGDFVMLSFGRDKAISGVTGGTMLSRRMDVSRRLQQNEDSARDLSLFTIKRLLLYPLLYAIARPVYGIGLGKVFLKACGILRILPPIVTVNEKAGHQSTVLHHLPNACAALALGQFRKLNIINAHRRSLTQFYLEACAEHGWPVLHGVHGNLPLQKFPMFMPNAEGIRHQLKKRNIHLHDGWTGCVICPSSTDPSMNRLIDDCDAAKSITEEILSLPTHPGTSMGDARMLVDCLRAQHR